MTDTDKQRNEIRLSPAEISAAYAESYGLVIGPLTMNLSLSQKQVFLLQSNIAQIEADNAELERQNSQLVAGAIVYEDRIHVLENELATRPTPERVADLEAQIAQLIEAGPTVAQTAGRELAKTEGRNKKAAPD